MLITPFGQGQFGHSIHLTWSAASPAQNWAAHCLLLRHHLSDCKWPVGLRGVVWTCSVEETGLDVHSEDQAEQV